MTDEPLRPIKTYRDIGVRDLWRALRRLLKSPAFTTAAVLTLSVGIGATTTMFSVANALLFRPLPFPDSSQLVLVRERQPGSAETPVAYPNFLDLKAAQTSFSAFALIRAEPLVLSPEGIGGDAEQVRGVRVTWDFLPALQLKPKIGRNFVAVEDTPGGERAALISADYFARRFARDPAVIGRTIIINGHPHTLVGVVPTWSNLTKLERRRARSFFGIFSVEPAATLEVFGNPDVLIPFHELRDDLRFNNRNDHHGAEIVARLKPGLSLAQATAELETQYAAIAEQYPRSNAGVGPVVQALAERDRSHSRQGVLILCGAVLCVLLIACANVANLLLARSVSRQREYAIRAALGAGHGQIMRELLSENNVLTLIGGLIGILIAVWARDLIVALAPAGTFGLEGLPLDAIVLLSTSLICLATEVLFGFWPAWQTSRTIELNTALAGGTRGVSSNPQTRQVRAALVVVQVALAMVLLSGAGMLLRSLVALYQQPLGFEPNGLVKFEITLPERRYDTEEKTTLFYRALLERVAALPAVSNAATSVVPLLDGRGWTIGYRPPGAPVGSGRELNAEANAVSADYFATLGVRPLRGRTFNLVDDPAEGAVHVIIDEAMARLHFAGRDPIGARLERAFGEDSGFDPGMIVVGVVPILRRVSVDRPPRLPQLYFHAVQVSEPHRTLLLRVALADPLSVVDGVKRELHEIDPDVAVAAERTADSLIAQSYAPQRLMTLLFGTFASIALVLALVGVYSVMSLTVAQRTREMGIRIALGAQPGSIARLLLNHGMILVGCGLALGLAGALALRETLHRFLPLVGVLQPWVVALVALALAGAAFVACWLPARRATRLDPVEVLRAE